MRVRVVPVRMAAERTSRVSSRGNRGTQSGLPFVPSALAASLLCSVCRPRKSVESNDSLANSTVRRVILPGLYDPNAPTEPEMFIEQFVPLGLLGGNGWADEAMMLRVGTGREADWVG